MKDFNFVGLQGRVTHDIGERDFSYLSTGTAKLRLSVAVNDTKKDGDNYIDEPSFIDIDYLGKGAEAVKPYISKGTQVLIMGELKQDRWEKDGVKHNRVYVKATMVRLIGGKKSSGENTFTPVENNNAIPSAQPHFVDEDIPF